MTAPLIVDLDAEYVEVSFEYDCVFFPTYVEKALDEEGELIPASQFDMPDLFTRHLHGFGGVKSVTPSPGSGYAYVLLVEKLAGELPQKIIGQVEDYVQQWNDDWREVETEVLEWFEQIKDSRDPLSVEDFDIMI